MRGACFIELSKFSNESSSGTFLHNKNVSQRWGNRFTGDAVSLVIVCRNFKWKINVLEIEIPVSQFNIVLVKRNYEKNPQFSNYLALVYFLCFY